MTQNIIPFSFESHAVRVVMRDGMPWFVAMDVCAALDIRNPRDAVARLEDDEKGVGTADTLGGAQEVGVVNESGLYALVFTSRKAAAKRFRKWVTAEVLPTIRQTGRYEAPRQAESASALLTADQQTTIKELVHSRVEALPQDKRAGAAIKCWSALKSKFGCTYKRIPSAQFTEALSLVARLPQPQCALYSLAAEAPPSYA